SCAAASAGPSNGAIGPLPSNAHPITTVVPAAEAVLAASAATAAIVARIATTAPPLLYVITPSSISVLGCRTLRSPGRLLRLDEPVHRRVQGDGHAVLLRL